MTITKKICDRCKKPLEYRGWTAIFKKPKFLAVTELLNGNPDGYSYCSMDAEICAECTKSFKDWFYEGRKEG